MTEITLSAAKLHPLRAAAGPRAPAAAAPLKMVLK